VRSSFVMDQPLCQTAHIDANTMPETRGGACENASVHKTVRRLLGIGLVAGVAYAIWQTSHMKSGSERKPSSGENSTSSR
jgi:hypothetical protein